MRDVFYYGKKPNVHPKEKFATSIEDARRQCTTEHFWIINEYCDYRNFDWDFDFEFLPDEDVWAENHNNVWPSQHQKDSGTWLCPNKISDLIIYRADVEPVIRKYDKNANWSSLEYIDETTFDFSWHPDPTDPPYTYIFGTQWQKTGGPIYTVPGIHRKSAVKHVDVRVIRATRLPNKEAFNILNDAVVADFDYSWHPDETEESYIYLFGNNQYPAEIMPTVQYLPSNVVRLASGKPIGQIKYIDYVRATLGEDKSKWLIPENIDDTKFDYSWVPNPKDPPYIYQFGTQWQKSGGPRYVVEGATEIKYVDIQKVKSLSDKHNWEVIGTVTISDFDYSWHPDDTDEPYIYVFGNNQYPAEIMPTIQYVPKNAVRLSSGKAIGQIKYVSDIVATIGANKTNWIIPENIIDKSFDFSWVPNPKDPPYIYQFGTQWHDRGGPTYVPDTIIRLSSGKPIGQIKYVTGIVATLREDKSKWFIPENIDDTGFDYSWVPHPDDPPYIYQFGTQWQKTGGPKYVVEGATEIKYVDIQKVKTLPSVTNWEIINNVTISDFDYSWHPDETDEAYLYVFGNNQYPAEMMPTIQYVPNDAVRLSSDKAIGQIKYINDIVATLGENRNNWIIYQQIDEIKFDFSWVPNPKNPPYIYRWGNKYISNVYKPTVEYIVEGATEIKYMDDNVIVLPESDRWHIPNNIDDTGFDYTWRPDPLEPNLIWQFGTQWQKTGGPRYIMPNATEVKYIDLQKVKILPNKDNWVIPKNLDVTNFDFSWHPDDTNPPYIYKFPTQWAISGGPIYKVDGATETKYVDTLKATALPCKDNWVIPDTIDSASFDFSWHPDFEGEAFVYQIGTQWQKTGGPRYLTPGVHKNSAIKYVDTDIIKAINLPNKENFFIIDGVTVSDFDYSWHPDDTDDPYIYVFGNNYYPAEVMPTIEYIPKNAVRLSSGKAIGQIKYVTDVVATLGANKTNWDINESIDDSLFDYSWVPNPKDPPYIYAWGNQWNRPEDKISIQYVVEGATEYKYMKEHVIRKPCMTNWIVPNNINDTGFDYSWEPSPADPPFIYQFGTQWQKTGGPRYVVEGAIEIKYISVQKVKILPNKENFIISDNIVVADFDYSWHPDDTDEPYIYVFGNNYYPAEVMPTIKYAAPIIPRLSSGKPIGQIKYVNDIIATLNENKTNWIIPEDIDQTKFDFSWVPHPNEEPYIYKFGTQHQKTGGPQYIPSTIPRLSSGAPIGQIKYVDGIKAKKLPNQKYWNIPSNIDVTTFDFSWHPDDTSPPVIYQFGTLLDRNNGPRYTHPDVRDEVIVYLERIEKEIEEVIEETIEVVFPKYYISTTLEDLVKEHPNEMFWALNPNLDYSDFDFNWRPNIDRSQYESEYVHAFGSSESENTQTYLVNSAMWEKGFRELNWVIDKKLDDETLFKMFKKSDMFFVDRSNSESQIRFEKLKSKYPNIQKTRYLNSWVDTINRCINRASSNLCWILNSELDYSNFDFDYYPNPWQMKMVHVFGTQWSHWGTTFMVNRDSFAEDTKWIKIIEHLNNLNFVKDRTAIADNNVYDIYVVDHGNKETATVVNQLTNKASGKAVNTIKYTENYLLTFRNLLRQLPEKKEHYIWLCSSICDYSTFDFSYICDPFAREQLHVFPSDKQKLGDTFLVNINKLRELIDNMTLLNEYNKINYNQHQTVKRLEPPTIITNYDSHVLSVMEDFDFPYAVFLSEDNKDLKVTDDEPISLWSSDTKNIVITSTGGTRIIVPKEAKNYVDTQLYDYPYIKKASRLVPSNVLDIVFLSNGEPNADENYENLLKLTRGLPNKVTRIDGINGRVAAYHKTAEVSQTSWYFVVWGKLFVNPKFDWSWQPDRLQIPKNYIFHAKNPLNGLVYGHQAVVAYNKKLALSTKGNQLDFTMESPHQVVPILSGTANYNSDAWTTWRTAFRECIKLRYDNTEESKNRLKIWLTKADGDFADFSIQGANDAIEYFDNVDGEYSKLKLSYEWEWLRAKFQKFD